MFKTVICFHKTKQNVTLNLIHTWQGFFFLIEVTTFNWKRKKKTKVNPTLFSTGKIYFKISKQLLQLDIKGEKNPWDQRQVPHHLSPQYHHSHPAG